MYKKLMFMLVTFFFTTSAFTAIGPAIECRFAALKDGGRVAMDQFVGYTLNPEIGVSGDFEPYNIEISAFLSDLTIAIYLEEEPLSGLQIPIINVINVPPGGSIFGIQTIFHESADGFVSIRYECKKVI